MRHDFNDAQLPADKLIAITSGSRLLREFVEIFHDM